MAEIINRYETIFIIDKDKTEEETNDIVEKFKTLIASSGTIESVDIWGKKRLAYPINDKNEGFYVMVNFSAAPEFPKELDRIYGITDGIERSLIIRKDEETKE